MGIGPNHTGWCRDCQKEVDVHVGIDGSRCCLVCGKERITAVPSTHTPTVIVKPDEKVVVVTVPHGWKVSVLARDSGIAIVPSSKFIPGRKYASMVELKAERQQAAPEIVEPSERGQS